VLVIKNPIGINFSEYDVVSAFNLHQNFPNPFNPVTMIKFEIHREAHAVLLICDMYGKEVESLVSKQLGKGIYEVEWNAAGYSSGVYIYRLFAGGFSVSKKMVLIK
jgi:hypothetical protein